MKLSVIVTENEKSCLLAPTRVSELEDCNHYEANIRLIHIATQVDVPTIIRDANGCVCFYDTHLFLEEHRSAMENKTDHENFIRHK